MADRVCFKYVDLFCGIGGFHTAAAKLGGECVLACDIDARARRVYQANYGAEPLGDIHKIKSIPQCDMLCAGFPCVAFSSIGKRKGLCDPRGRLFYEITRLIRGAAPQVLLFENVRGLLNDENGKTWEGFKKELERLGYSVYYHVLDAANFGVPQHRERVYIVGLLNGVFDFSKLAKTKKHKVFKSIMSEIRSDRDREKLMVQQVKRFDEYMCDKMELKNRVVLRARKNNYINNKLYSSDGIVGTLCAGFIPVVYDERLEIARTMTVPEMLACQGFSKRFVVPDGITRTDMQRMTGNAVCVNVAHAIMKELVRQGCLKISTCSNI